MLPRVVDTRHAGDYLVWLRFSDGLSGEIDRADQLWGPVFEITWPNGADLSPSWLHETLRAKVKSAASE